MPTYPSDIQDKLDALQALTGADRKPAEMCAIYWPSPIGTTVYSAAMYTELPWWPDLAAAIETYFGDPLPITLTLIPDSTPFIDLPRAASVSDDSINLTFDDKDGEFSTLLMAYGEGIRTEVFCYWPTVDLLLSMWRGMLHQPKDMDRAQVKITATAGWRAANMLVPKRPHATSCPFIFGAFFSSQSEIDQANGCPYNAHIGGPIGVPGETDCSRLDKDVCFSKLNTFVYWPGFETRPDAIPNNQTQGPNLLAKAIGNESNLSDPIRAIAGERYVKALNLLAFRIEEDTNHPEDGFGAALFEVSEGLLLTLWEFRINGQLVGAEHFQIRLGALGQTPTDWSPSVNSYSGTAIVWGRIQGDFRDAQASDFSGSVRGLGSRDVRVYSDADTYVEAYTTNRAWWLLKILAEARWGYGQDYPRFNIQSFIDAAQWCDELVTLTDSNGNTFSGVRSTFNAEVTARAIQQQVKDLCTAGRLGIPFEFDGKDVIVPLKAEDVNDPAIPTFTDEGADRNIIYDGVKSSLSWSVISDETMVNQWTVNFDDASNGGVDTQYIFGDQAQQLRAGRAWGDRSKRVVNKSQAGYGINSGQEAARFGNSLLYLGPLDSGGILNPFSVKFTTWYSDAFNVQNYKLIKVVNAKLQSRMSAYFTARGLSPYPGADFTCFRVTKYTRKGDLRVEIEAQQYATIDIVLDTSCHTGAEGAGIFSALNNAQQNPDDLSITRDGGTPESTDAYALSDYFVAGTSCARWEMRVFFNELETSDEIYFVIEDEFGGSNKYGWHLVNQFGSDQSAAPYHGTGADPTPIYYGPEGSDSLEQVGYTVGFRFGIYYHNGTVILYQNSQWTTDTDDFIGGELPPTGSGSYTYTGLPTDRRWRLRVYVVNSDSKASLITETNGGTTGISPPRDFTAVVDATTGIVELHWAPPALHPELVTGYVLLTGSTVVMPATLTNHFSVTLSPGTYTYRVRAEGTSLVSGYAYVTFMVPTPPVTGADLLVIDDLTLENVLDDLTIEQVTV
jgi:hypothetical protein